MAWDESLATGIPIIDLQHKELFRQVEMLLDHTQRNRVEEMLTFLGDYVVKHFGVEELMQKSSNFPHAAEHKLMHDNFITAFVKLNKEYHEGEDQLLSLMKITKIALNWLQEHIGFHDREFGEFFQSSSCSDSLGRKKESGRNQVPK
ncbi:MAG: hemerythrin family protein [Planctomycetota bacterium]|jgi:hemerythrin|nr:hemerythrin family protein [Planctomycetota bacterium]